MTKFINKQMVLRQVNHLSRTEDHYDWFRKRYGSIWISYPDDSFLAELMVRALECGLINNVSRLVSSSSKQRIDLLEVIGLIIDTLEKLHFEQMLVLDR